MAKSPISPPLAFPFIVNSSGISLLSDDGIEIMGQEISTIHCLGEYLNNISLLLISQLPMYYFFQFYYL